jgi:integrase/recombinase XerD
VIEFLFNCPRAAARHQSAALLDARVRFLEQCLACGSPRGTLRRLAHELLVIVDQFNLEPEGEVRPEDIEVAAHRWAYREPSHHKSKDVEKIKRHFTLVATRWLRFLGRLQAPHAAWYQNFIDEFACYMERDKGLSPMTIRGECGHVRRFLARHCSSGERLRDLSIQQIDEAIAQKGRRDGCCRASIGFYAASLRAFFRYAETKDWCRKGLATAIMAPYVYQHELIPSGPSWEVVQHLLEMTASDRPVDIRDRAILMLFAIYGLRAGEVQRLQLKDFDWHREVIHIARPKPRTVQQYPLVPSVGEAILRYLQEVRLHRSSRHVFLTLRAPYSPLSCSALWKAVSDRLRPLKLSIRHQGPHSLRHACATHLLAQGLSLKEIGDHLGHRDPESTRVYAKVDLVGLREVAEFSLGGLL